MIDNVYVIEENSTRRMKVDKNKKRFLEQCYKIGMKNPWCSGRVEDCIVEEDRLNKESFSLYLHMQDIETAFKHGNWCLGQAFVYKNLCFINQVDGGDEWLTIKQFGEEALAFESISWKGYIREGNFIGTMKRLMKATKAQCRKCEW